MFWYQCPTVLFHGQQLRQHVGHRHIKLKIKGSVPRHLAYFGLIQGQFGVKIETLQQTHFILSRSIPWTGFLLSSQFGGTLVVQIPRNWSLTGPCYAVQWPRNLMHILMWRYSYVVQGFDVWDLHTWCAKFGTNVLWARNGTSAIRIRHLSIRKIIRKVKGLRIARKQPWNIFFLFWEVKFSNRFELNRYFESNRNRIDSNRIEVIELNRNFESIRIDRYFIRIAEVPDPRTTSQTWTPSYRYLSGTVHPSRVCPD